MVEIMLTKHAIDRARDRLSLSEKSLQRLSEKAFFEGIKHGDTKGKLNRFISRKYFNNPAATNIRIYGEVIYFFSSDFTLMTLYQIPNEIKKVVNKKRNEAKQKSGTTRRVHSPHNGQESEGKLHDVETESE